MTAGEGDGTNGVDSADSRSSELGESGDFSKTGVAKASESEELTETNVSEDSGTEDDTGRGTPDEERGDDGADPLAAVDTGAGCTEIWEHLSERRNDN